MKYSTPIIAFALVACGACHFPEGPERPDMSSPPTVARLMVIDDNGDTNFSCTAWKIGDGLVATAGHCCTEGTTYSLEGPNVVPGGEVSILSDLGGGEDDPADRDVCIMSGHLTGAPVQLAQFDPPVGSRVWTAGFPRGTFLISDGVWAGRNSDNLGVCSTVANPGASGSPVLNSRGQAVGVLVRYMRGMDNVTYVAPLEKLRAAIQLARSLHRD